MHPLALRAGATLIETGLPLDWLCDGHAPVLAAGKAVMTLVQEVGADLVQLNMPALGAAALPPIPVIAVAHGCVASGLGGRFFDETEIEQRKPTLLTDLVRGIPGVHIVPSIWGGVDVVMSSGNCRPDLVIESVRGNLDTRLRKLDEGQYDAILLAAAGLKRLGWADRIAEILPPDVMRPAVGSASRGTKRAALSFAPEPPAITSRTGCSAAVRMTSATTSGA